MRIRLPISSSLVCFLQLLFQGAPTLDPELWTYSKQFYYEAGDTLKRPRLKVFYLKSKGLPKLHQKHGCEKTEANYLDWQVHFLLFNIRLIGWPSGNGRRQLCGRTIRQPDSSTV